MTAQPMDLVRAIALGAADTLRELLAPVRAPLPNGTSHACMEAYRRQAQLVQRGDALMAALVAYAQAQNLVPKPLELLPFLSSFAHLLWQTLDHRISVRVDVERECPALLVDAAALEAALIRIAANAQAAMPRGGRLLLRGALDGQTGRFVRLCVVDSGTGMSPEVAERAADPFFTTGERSRSWGMGLSAVAGFAVQSGGHLHVTSGTGRGTTICMHLPAAVGCGNGSQ